MTIRLDLVEGITLLDSAEFTPGGRRLLASLGVLTPDPLRVEAEQWLSEHKGCVTPASRRVREALGPPWPDEWLRVAEKVRKTPWKGPLP